MGRWLLSVAGVEDNGQVNRTWKRICREHEDLQMVRDCPAATAAALSTLLGTQQPENY